MTERKDGYYWLLISEGWVIGEWRPKEDCWYLTASHTRWSNDSGETVGNQIPSNEELTSRDEEVKKLVDGLKEIEEQFTGPGIINLTWTEKHIKQLLSKYSKTP